MMEPAQILTMMAGVFTVLQAVRKFFFAFKAKDEFKSAVSKDEVDRLKSEFGNLLSTSSILSEEEKRPILQKLAAELDDVVKKNQALKGGVEKAIRSGLNQPSAVGKGQYAEELYASVADDPKS